MAENASGKYAKPEQGWVLYRAKGTALEHLRALSGGDTDAARAALRKLGVLDPQTVQLRKTPQSYPRAYRTAAELHEISLKGGKTETVIRVPVDYNGRHDAPDGAVPLGEAESARVNGMIKAGDTMPPSLPPELQAEFRPLVGTALPEDYDEQTAQHVSVSTGSIDIEHCRVYRVPLTQSFDVRKFYDAAKAAKGDPSKLQGEELLTVLGGEGGKRLPRLHEYSGGMYLVYHDVKPGEVLPLDEHGDLGRIEQARESEEKFRQMFGPDASDVDFVSGVEKIEPAPPGEFLWFEDDRLDDELGIEKPEPPPQMDHLFEETLFRAEGRSLEIMSALLDGERQTYDNQKKLEHALFGQPQVTNTMNVGGHTFSTYKSQFHPVYDDGKLVGLRCDWTPLHPNYTGMENIDPPEGWVELEKHPGVFRPDPEQVPAEIVELFEKCSYPDYKAETEVFGDKPIIRVDEPAGGYPRAYRTWPHVHLAGKDRETGRRVFYIDVPKDYKGEVFRPKDSRRVTKYEFGNFRAMLGDMYEPHLYFRDEGAKLPQDFTPTKKDEEPKTRYFKLAGKSQAIYEQFEKDRERAQKLRKDFIKAVGGAGSYSYQGTKILSVEFAETVPENWKSTRSHRATQVDDDGNYHDVTMYDCVPDEDTAEGRKLAKKMESFPEEPDYLELQRRWRPDAPKMPNPLYNYDTDGALIFTYDMERVKKWGGEFAPPPDAIELPAALMEWHTASKRDIQCGMKPPPMPDDLKKAVGALKKKMEKAGVKKGASGPKP